MKIGFERYEDVFERVLKEEKVDTQELTGFDSKFENLSKELENKMTKMLSCMAGRDGKLYNDSEVAIANRRYFKKCMTNRRTNLAA